MELARLKALIDLVSNSRIAELEIVEGEERVRIVRGPSSATSVPSPPKTATASVLPSPAAGVSIQTVPSVPREHSSGSSVVKAPMFGVFHPAPSPGAPPLVDIGDEVVVGQKLCMIEAMKVFHVIEADRAGKITAVLVEGGQEVEGGQPLFEIE